MGVMPVNSLLLSMSIPMMLSMLVQALYNVVDSMFVARLSEDALTAVTLAFPVQNLMIAIGIGTCVGVNAQLSRSLGARNFGLVNKIADNAVFLTAVNYAIFALIGFFGIDLYFASQTDIPQILQYGSDYLFWCCVLSFGFFGQVTMARLLQSTGLTFYSMITQLIGAVINIILDPILIFGLFGFPRLEVTGAAIATVIGQIAATTAGFAFNKILNKEIKLSLRGVLHPELAIVRHIYAVGIPSIAMSSIASVMTYGMNLILISFSSTATALFGIYFKLQSFVFMPVFGLNNGMVPIIAYNFGAQKKARIIQAFRLSVIYAVVVMLGGLLALQLLPTQLLLLFKASPDMLAIGVPALRIISLGYLFPGFSIVVLSSFQALGHGVKGFFVSVVRQLVFLLPVAYLLSLTGRLELIWFAFPICEAVTVLMCVLLLLRVYRQEIQPMPD